ncbi:MAG TPA: carboxylating nicotinate-nucleotide diphosphorylase [Bryobacteraceae bacterium]|nr:carboxylating nicotinate-nucleotide diphosphorylase [Bryobacteraceae bacterium]
MIDETVRWALREDIGAGDVTTRACVPARLLARGRYLAREPLVVAGLDLLEVIYRERGGVDNLAVLKRDGDRCAAGDVLATVRGRARTLLECERVALNFLQRLSGVATAARAFADAVEGTGCRVLDTRKTTPGLRQMEKRAAAAGGVTNHRMGLFDAVLIKNNHIAAAGGVRQALESARGEGAPIEIEVRTREELQEALESGAEHLLLDNLTPEEAREWVREIGGRAKVELSGGITLANVRAYAEAGADFVSAGAITHSARAMDISFRLELEDDAVQPLVVGQAVSLRRADSPPVEPCSLPPRPVNNRPQDDILPHKIDLDRLRGEFPGRTIVHYPTLDSTMRAAASLQAGAVVLADEQTAGQGRHGRSWHSEAGAGIYCSTVLKPAPLLTLALGLAAADAIAQSTGAACDLRWPNDVMAGGRKVAGILVQLVDGAAIAGIGINVSQTWFPAELAAEATSLRMMSGREIPPTDLLIALLRAVDRFTAEPPETVLRLFTRASSYASGRRVTVELPDGTVAGTTAGLTPEGFLVLRKDDGTDTLVIAGGVRAAGA